MTTPNRILLLAYLCVAAIPARGTQKQNLTIAEPLKALPGLPVKTSLSEAEARSVVTAVLPDALTGTIMLHAVGYQATEFAVSDQSWYTVNLAPPTALETVGDLHASQRYKDPRIFGASHLGIVYLYVMEGALASDVETIVRQRSGDIRTNHKPLVAGVPAAQLIPLIDTALAKLSGFKSAKIGDFTGRVAKAKSGQPAAAELTELWSDVDLEATIQEILSKGSSDQIVLVADSDSSVIGPLGNTFVRKVFSALATVSYGISIESKDKAPFVNLKQIIGTAFGGQSLNPLSIRIPLAPLALAAGKTFDTTLTTSNIVVTATYSDSGKDTQIGTQTYDNEGRYWYDFSFLLPFKSYNDLSYDSTANGLTARKISKNNLYGAFDFGVPRDTKNMKFQLVPVLLYGIPITGQPLKHHLFAASVGLNYVNFFAGTELDAKDFYHDFSKPLAGDNVFRVWRTHLVYGINFDVATITKALSKSTSTSK